MTKTVYLLIGLPGSGKSSQAQIIRAFGDYKEKKSIVVSADHFFVNKLTGVYTFDVAHLGAAHNNCQIEFTRSTVMEYDHIVVDNTNLTRKDRKFYIEQAKEFGYSVQLITIGEFTDEACELYASRNVHGVPLDKIILMRDKWKRDHEVLG